MLQLSVLQEKEISSSSDKCSLMGFDPCGYLEDTNYGTIIVDLKARTAIFVGDTIWPPAISTYYDIYSPDSLYVMSEIYCSQYSFCFQVRDATTGDTLFKIGRFVQDSLVNYYEWQ
jgi:hypothetical protein